MAFWIVAVLVRLLALVASTHIRVQVCSSDPAYAILAPVVSHPICSQPNPPWVARELIRLKAWSPELGCRVLAEVFNRQFEDRRVTVGGPVGNI